MQPSFALDFAAAMLDPSITFARAGNTASVVNSAGVITGINANLPRFDYDPITLACKGLLIEESRTNKALYSSDFRNTADAGATRPWTYTNATLSRTGIGPDGGTANKIIPNVGATDGRVNQGIPIVSGVVHTISIYGKADGFSTLNITNNLTGTFRENRFNVSTGQVISAGTGLTCSVSVFNNGYYRCIMTATSGTTSLTVQVRVSETGDGVKGILTSGLQVEEGAFATSLIPTLGSVTTRNADVATITGADFSGFWNAGVGGATVTALPSTVSGTRPLVQFDDGTANEIIALRGSTTNPELYIVDGGSAQAQIDAGTIAANTSYRLAAGWATDACAASVSGGSPVLDGAATIPTVTQARLGSDGTNYLNGHLQTIEYYDRKPTNATLQSLSSSAGRYSVLSPVLNPVVQS